MNTKMQQNGRRRSSAPAEGAQKQTLLDVVADGFYVNVLNADAFLVRIAYSKASIAFICLIATLTAFNTLMFTAQLTDTKPLCNFNDYLPLGNDLRRIVMPIVYYCRFLELSVPTNIAQLLFCFAALVCALNRRSTLFIFSYAFICLTIFVTALFLVSLLLINPESHIRPATDRMLHYVLENDTSFCSVLEPMLDCAVPIGHTSSLSTSSTPSTTTTPFPIHQEGEVMQTESQLALSHISTYDENDAISRVCGYRSRNLKLISNGVSCTDYLSSSLMSRSWLLGLVLQYVFVMFAGAVVSVYAVMRRGKRPSTASELKELERVEMGVEIN